MLAAAASAADLSRDTAAAAADMSLFATIQQLNKELQEEAGARDSAALAALGCRDVIEQLNQQLQESEGRLEREREREKARERERESLVQDFEDKVIQCEVSLCFNYILHVDVYVYMWMYVSTR